MALTCSACHARHSFGGFCRCKCNTPRKLANVDVPWLELEMLNLSRLVKSTSFCATENRGSKVCQQKMLLFNPTLSRYQTAARSVAPFLLRFGRYYYCGYYLLFLRQNIISSDCIFNSLIAYRGQHPSLRSTGRNFKHRFASWTLPNTLVNTKVSLPLQLNNVPFNKLIESRTHPRIRHRGCNGVQIFIQVILLGKAIG